MFCSASAQELVKRNRPERCDDPWRLLRRSRGNKKGSQSCLSYPHCGLRGLHAVLLTEFLHPSGSIDDFLFTRVEGVTIGTYLDMQRLAHVRAWLEGVAAGASHVDFSVFGMNSGFHGVSFRGLAVRRCSGYPTCRRQLSPLVCRKTVENSIPGPVRQPGRRRPQTTRTRSCGRFIQAPDI